jgi:2-dehydro-3-deoxygluconokinase
VRVDVVTLGESLVSFVAEEVGRVDTVAHFRKRVGGAEMNTAIGLARLGATAAWISRLGADPFGDEIVRALRGEGVRTDAVTRDPSAPTGLMIKEFRAGGVTHVHYYRAGSAAAGLSADDVDQALVTAARRVHLTGITLALGDGPRAAVLRLVECAAEHGVPISFDPNLRRKLTTPERAVEHWRAVFPFVTDLLLSEEEARLCTGAGTVDEMLDELVGAGIPTAVIKQGAQGATGRSDGVHASIDAIGGVAVDSVGAGDAFNAGYLFEVLRGAPLAERLRTGAWVAGHVVGGYGDWEGLPTRREYDAAYGGVATR